VSAHEHSIVEGEVGKPTDDAYNAEPVKIVPEDEAGEIA